MKIAIVNLGAIVTGDWRDPHAKGDSILMSQGKIAPVGTAPPGPEGLRRRHRHRRRPCAQVRPIFTCLKGNVCHAF